MTFNFEWDKEKEKANLKKHKVSFDEASTVFDDPFYLIIEDTPHSTGEYRFIVIGYSQTQQLLFVVYTERSDNIRIISARPVTNRERRAYEQSI